MSIEIYVIPILILALLIFCIIKKVSAYDVFVSGASSSLKLVAEIFPYLVAIFLLCELFEVSGLSQIFVDFLSPVFEFFGVPKELIKLVIIKPFSGSGSLALLTEIIKNNGVDSYITKCACAVYGSSETIFYISAIYFTKCKNKKATKAILISLVATIISTILTCLICNIF